MHEKERNKIIAANIKHYIKQNGITQKKLAQEIGISPSTMSDYMNLRSNPSHGVIQKIADYFQILKSDIDTTYKDEDSISSLYDQLDSSRQKAVYCFAKQKLEEQKNIVEFPKRRIVNGRSTAAGLPILGDGQDSEINTTVLNQRDVPSGADEIVTIAGDSMEPLYREGTQVFVHWQPEVEQGEVAIVAIRDEGVTCKKLYYENNKVILRSINDLYEDRIISMEDIRVIGKVL